MCAETNAFAILDHTEINYFKKTLWGFLKSKNSANPRIKTSKSSRQTRTINSLHNLHNQNILASRSSLFLPSSVSIVRATISTYQHDLFLPLQAISFVMQVA